MEGAVRKISYIRKIRNDILLSEQGGSSYLKKENPREKLLGGLCRLVRREGNPHEDHTVKPSERQSHQLLRRNTLPGEDRGRFGAIMNRRRSFTGGRGLKRSPLQIKEKGDIPILRMMLNRSGLIVIIS